MTEEYIKKKDALNIFSKHMFAGYRGNGKSFFSEIVMPTFYCAIEDLPAANVVEVKHGEWIDKHGVHRCSCCNGNALVVCDQDKETFAYLSDFCPNCGADMRGERKDEK